MLANSFNANTKLINMSILRATIPIGLGDIIYIKGILDNVKHRYDQIRLKFHREIIASYNIQEEYNVFLDEMGSLFFSESPYVLLSESEAPFYGLVSLCNDNGIKAIKPNLSSILCKGEPLTLDGEYIVINTKVRYLDRNHLDEKVRDFWLCMNKLSGKYKIVILGERVVELHHGYRDIGTNHVYSIYDSILANLPNDKLIDLTIPALGQTSPQLSKIQQDCLIMNKSKFVVTLGVGGGFCMATAVANTIGYRMDDDSIANDVFSITYPDAMITKNWNTFINSLGSYE